MKGSLQAKRLLKVKKVAKIDKQMNSVSKEVLVRRLLWMIELSHSQLQLLLVLVIRENGEPSCQWLL
jgi:hypothetical protein